MIEAAKNVDAVINAADSDNPFVVITLLSALAGSGKLFIHTSGSSLVGGKAAGELSHQVFHEDTPFQPLTEKVGRVAINQRVLAAAQEDVCSVVLCHSLIYGQGHGIKKSSIQVRALAHRVSQKEWCCSLYRQR